MTPTDPSWPQQWALRRVDLPLAWNVTEGDPSVVVGVVDTGITPSRELAPNLVAGWDFVDDDGTPNDTWGHGSQVASVLAARANNRLGIAGVCWRCRVMPIRIAAQREASQQNIARGIRYAVDHGMRIVNVSAAAPGPPTEELAGAVAYAQAHDVLVVASAGNAGDDAPRYPAALPGVLGVAATDESDRLAFWSSRGSWVALAAPSCYVVYDPTLGPASICGTSFTPAVVSGIAGLLLSVKPDLSAQQLAKALVESAVPVNGIGGGRVDALAALKAVGVDAASHPAASPPTSAGQQLQVENGKLEAVQTVPLRLAAGRLDAQLASRAAGRCTLSLKSSKTVVVALPADHGAVLSLSTVVAAGRHTLVLRCAKPRGAGYTLEVAARFARGT